MFAIYIFLVPLQIDYSNGYYQIQNKYFDYNSSISYTTVCVTKLVKINVRSKPGDEKMIMGF